MVDAAFRDDPKVARLSPRGNAMMVLGLDDPVPQSVMEEIRSLPHVNSARLVEMPEVMG